MFGSPDVKTKNWVLQSKWSYFMWYPLRLLISTSLYFHGFISSGLIVLLFVSSLSAFAYTWILQYFFRWLYPRIEIESSRQVRFRKVFLGVLGTLVLSLIPNMISK